MSRKLLINYHRFEPYSHVSNFNSTPSNSVPIVIKLDLKVYMKEVDCRKQGRWCRSLFLHVTCHTYLINKKQSVAGGWNKLMGRDWNWVFIDLYRWPSVAKTTPREISSDTQLHGRLFIIQFLRERERVRAKASIKLMINWTDIICLQSSSLFNVLLDSL